MEIYYFLRYELELDESRIQTAREICKRYLHIEIDECDVIEINLNEKSSNPNNELSEKTADGPEDVLVVDILNDQLIEAVRIKLKGNPFHFPSFHPSN
jgi:hypothetical protein